MKMMLCLGLLLGMNSIAGAETVYRCGTPDQTVYQQAPCDEGRAVDVSDTRTPQQRAEAQAAAWRTRQDADRMEKQRLQQEEQARRHAERQAALAAKAAASAQRKKVAEKHPPMVIRLKPKAEKTPKKEGDSTSKSGH